MRRTQRRPPQLDLTERATTSRLAVDIALAAVTAAASLVTVLGGALLFWLYADADVPPTTAIAIAGPQTAATLGVASFAAPGAVVFAASAVALVAFERGTGRRLPTAGRIGVLLAVFVVLTPNVGYWVTGAPFRASGGLDIGIVTLRDLTGDADLVSADRDPKIGAIMLPAPCARKRPRPDRNDRPYRGAGLFVCAGYFVGQQDGYVVLGGNEHLHYFSAQDVLRLDVTGAGAEFNFGLPSKGSLGPFAPPP